MANATIDLGATTHAKPSSDVAAFAEQMTELATRAREVPELSGRAVLYGEMLHTCASCHAVVRPRAIAGR